MAVQPPSLRQWFVVSQPAGATPVLPVQPRITKAQEEEMKGWSIKDTWRDIMECCWRFRGTFGIRNSAASSLADIAKLVDREDIGDVVTAKNRWGEERDFD